ncbi:MAG: PadR family transcriptional regulator [Promethearchaeota archaeon]
MIKRIKQFQPEALMSSDDFRAFVEKAESEVLRGISTIVVLKIIDDSGAEGIYGYKILQTLEKATKQMLVIEEGTLYPLLKKLEKDNLVSSEKKRVSNRPRKYYFITEEGRAIQNHLNGFLTKLIESMGSFLDMNVELHETQFFYCPNCANKIDTRDNDAQYCEVCGMNLYNPEKGGYSNE